MNTTALVKAEQTEINHVNLMNSIKIGNSQQFLIGSNVINAHSQNRLAETYPSQGFIENSRSSGDKKHYQMSVCKLISNNQHDQAFTDLSPLWQSLVTQITAKNYIQSLFALVNMANQPYRLDVGLFKFKEGGWISPHVDNPGKILTQIFYFNLHWHKNWGGHLKLLNSSKQDDVSFVLAPLGIYSAIIMRHPEAWHMVEPITPGMHAKRLTMQLEIWEDHG